MEGSGRHQTRQRGCPSAAYIQQQQHPPSPLTGRAKTIGYPFGDKAERPGVSFQRARLSGTACIAVARPANHGTQLSASGRQRDSRPVAWREISVDRILTCAPQELVMMESRLQLLAEFDASSLVSSCRCRFSVRPQHIKRLGTSLTDHRPLLGRACELNRLMPSPPMLVAPRIIWDDVACQPRKLDM